MSEIDVAALLEKKVFSYHKDIDHVSFNFIVVGAGGTGGYLIPHLARMVSIKNQESQRTSRDAHKITIIDADKIEDKNLLRQQFVSADIGKNKAEVMAKRYGRSFNMSIAYVTDYVEKPEQLLSLMSNHYSINVLVDCVDNNKTRLVIKEAYEAHSKEGNEVVSISSGNEERAGQVIFSYRKQSAHTASPNLGISLIKLKSDSPDLFDIFPLAEVGKLPTELSCAEAAVSDPQNIATNMTAANIIFGMINKMLNGEPVTQLAVFFDTTTMMQSVYQAKASDVKRLLSMTSNNGAMFDYIDEAEIPFSKEESVSPPTLDEAEERKVFEKEVTA